MKERFEEFIENRCPTFWQRVEECGYKDREEVLQGLRITYPRYWFSLGFPWWETTEGYDYWAEADDDWIYIVEQEEKK